MMGNCRNALQSANACTGAFLFIVFPPASLFLAP